MSTLVRSVMAAAHSRFDPNDTTESFIKRRWGDVFARCPTTEGWFPSAPGSDML